MKKLFIFSLVLILLLGASCSRKTQGPSYKKSEKEISFENDVKTMIDEKQNLDGKEGVPPIINAAANGYLDSVALLIKNGANVNVREGLTRSTPLHAAIATATAPLPDEMEQKIIKLLLENKALVDTTDKMGVTPLAKSANNGRIEAFKLLLNAGANFEIKDNNGMSAMHHAASKGYHEIVKILIERKMSVNELSNNNETPLDLANYKASQKDYEKLRKDDKSAFPGADYDKTIKLLKENGGKTGKEVVPPTPEN